MAKRIIVLSGPVASGKTSLGSALIERYGFKLLKTQELIRTMTSANLKRDTLQKAGAVLDRRTGGQWVAQALAREVGLFDQDAEVIVDSARIRQQVQAIRAAFRSRVVHVHLTAPLEVLASRYAARAGSIKELASYRAVRTDATEKRVEELASIADIVIDTQRSSAEDVCVRVAGHLGLYGRSLTRVVDVIVGGQYGSEGKGNIASYLAREYKYLVRVGGCNAGHKVFEEPRPYTFRQLPSGTRRCEAKLILGPGAVLDQRILLREIAECEVSPDRLYIDPQAIVVESTDRSDESRALVRAIASTGQGVGAATARKILGRDGAVAVRLARDIKDFSPFVRETLRVLDDAYAEGEKILLEGTQGTGLSLHHGFYPYVTSRDTTVGGCLAEAGIAPSRVRRIVMVCRTYPIRVENPSGGTSGPMGKEITWDVVATRSKIPVKELKESENTSTTNRNRRVGEFDWTLLRKAVSLNGPTDIALTFSDYISKDNKKARRFEQLTSDTIRLIEEIERVASVPVSLIATHFAFRCIIDRRRW